MSDELTFMMGEFAALFPTDRHYAKNHMWAQLVVGDSVGGDSVGGSSEGGRFRFGFAAYAVRLLQDVYFLDWHVEEGTTLSQAQEIGEIESSKAESSLYAPVAGRLVAINQTLLKDPSAINVDKYGTGWIFEIEVEDDNPVLTPDQYIAHLEEVWAVTQRTIKGQLNA